MARLGYCGDYFYRRDALDYGSCFSMVVEGENKIKTIKLTQVQLNMLRDAWSEYSGGFWDEVEQSEEKRRIKTFEAIQKKLW